MEGRPTRHGNDPADLFPQNFFQPRLGHLLIWALAAAIEPALELADTHRAFGLGLLDADDPAGCGAEGCVRELALEFGACAETLVLVARRLDGLEKLRAELLSHHPRLNNSEASTLFEIVRDFLTSLFAVVDRDLAGLV